MVAMDMKPAVEILVKEETRKYEERVGRLRRRTLVIRKRELGLCEAVGGDGGGVS